MGGGGAAVAAIAAARQRRIQEIVDAFRLGDATSAERARSLDTLGLAPTGELKELIVDGVLMPGAREGTYYLSEVGYISQREGKRRNLKALVLVLAIIAVIGAVILPLLARRS